MYTIRHFACAAVAAISAYTADGYAYDSVMKPGNVMMNWPQPKQDYFGYSYVGKWKYETNMKFPRRNLMDVPGFSSEYTIHMQVVYPVGACTRDPFARLVRSSLARPGNDDVAMQLSAEETLDSAVHPLHDIGCACLRAPASIHPCSASLPLPLHVQTCLPQIRLPPRGRPNHWK